MKIILRVLSSFVIVPLGIICVFFGREILGEGYNFAVPEIDTRFTDRYDEVKFNNIQIEEDTNSVINLIGNPFYKQKLLDSVDLWYFTDDGKCQWMDFAWLGRELKIKDGKVVGINKPIHYD